MERQPDRASRDALIGAILEFLAGQDLLRLQDIRVALEREVDDASGYALLRLKSRLTTDNGWDYYSPDPLARRIHHLLAKCFLDPSSRVEGSDQLAKVGDAPLAIFANHLSYADANVVEILLRRCGCAAIADRLTAIAGPKVFTSRQRRFSSLCFGTIKVPQSAEVSSEEAALNAREVAIAAHRGCARQALCG
jgi:1-acyl-sn-glycerol-3-phosphate acyltransferase